MFDWRVLASLLNILLIVILIGLVIHFRDRSIKLEETNKVLEAQISSVLDDHEKYADMYRDVSNRLNTARILTLEGTLRLENMVIESDVDSDLHKWSKDKLPEEVKSVLTDMKESLIGGSYGK